MLCFVCSISPCSNMNKNVKNRGFILSGGYRSLSQCLIHSRQVSVRLQQTAPLFPRHNSTFIQSRANLVSKRTKEAKRKQTKVKKHETNYKTQNKTKHHGSDQPLRQQTALTHGHASERHAGSRKHQEAITLNGLERRPGAPPDRPLTRSGGKMAGRKTGARLSWALGRCWLVIPQAACTLHRRGLLRAV